MRDPQPTDEQWGRTLDEYRAVGWEGEDPAEWERMFWEAGFRQGVAAARLQSTDSGHAMSGLCVVDGCETCGLPGVSKPTDSDMIRCDRCGDELPSVKHRAHAVTPGTDEVVCPECLGTDRVERPMKTIQDRVLANLREFAGDEPEHEEGAEAARPTGSRKEHGDE